MIKVATAITLMLLVAPTTTAGSRKLAKACETLFESHEWKATRTLYKTRVHWGDTILVTNKLPDDEAARAGHHVTFFSSPVVKCKRGVVEVWTEGVRATWWTRFYFGRPICRNVDQEIVDLRAMLEAIVAPR